MVNDPHKTTYTMQVEDSITGIKLQKANVMAFAVGDSVVAAKAVISDIYNNTGLRYTRRYDVSIPKNDTDYQLVVDADGYMTRIIPLNHTNKSTFDLGIIKLMKMPKMLNEVTVTATKIRLYYDGDTLVYNADAFALPDGSMLDDLIRQLDGVTINEHGQIFCKGRKVHSLHLDGRKLFDGNPRTLLENLGAYTVSKLKVYEYTSSVDKFTGFKNVTDKPLIMDVVLKQEYAIGKWINIDAGYGTSNRYLGRAFGLGFSKTLALAAFVNANNLSSGDNPRQGEKWDPDKAGTDESRYLSGGLSYQFDPAGDKIHMSGSVAVNSDNIIKRNGSWRNILIPGSINSATAYTDATSKSLKILTDHSFTIQLPVVYLQASPTFSYRRGQTDRNSLSATFDADLKPISAEMLNAIYTDAGDEELLRLLVNRRNYEATAKTNGLGCGLSTLAMFKLPETDRAVHNIKISASGNYSDEHSSGFEQSTIDYGLSQRPEYRSYAYYRQFPSANWNASASTAYRIEVDGAHEFSLQYLYSTARGNSPYERYQLENLDNISFESLKFGQLPPENVLASVIDPDNSYWTKKHNQSHHISGVCELQFGRKNLAEENATGMFSVEIYPAIAFHQRTLDYRLVDYDTIAVRRDRLPSVLAITRYSAITKDGSKDIYVGLTWNSSPQLLTMNNLIDKYNTSDPLNVYKGNPSLRNSYTHKASQRITILKRKAPFTTFEFSFNESFTSDAIVSGSIYDPKTGVRTTSVYNVDGNHSFSASLNHSHSIYYNSRTNHNVRYNVMLNAGYRRTTSMDAVETAACSYVYYKNLSPTVSVTYSGSRKSFSLKWNGVFNRYDGTSADFPSYNATNMAYGASASMALPLDFKIQTDFTYYTRRGYSNQALNTNEAIWNITASWHWKKKNLTFMVDGYDLLGQVKKITYGVDALGHTEAWSNSLPRYFLLRLRYHIDVSPK
ncbi:MAG: outer membrane beta-barrel protein [Muribaculaceae bacterium]|nr:outer membrane beta-barrel protein [Muribaculaceae bacterium]